MSFKGLINFREIEKQPIEIAATQADPWVQELLARAAPSSGVTGIQETEWAQKCVYSASLSFSMAGSDAVLQGQFTAKVPASCSRCADLYETPRQAEFRIVLHRVLKGEVVDSSEDSGDPDYVLLERDEIDVREILAEQLIMTEPVAECPARRPDGSCTLCGKNPQFAGQSPDNSANSPFSKLRSLKLTDE